MSAGAPYTVEQGWQPLDRAKNVLGQRLTRQRGQLRLDGRPASTRQIIEAANEVLLDAGLPLIAYPGICFLPPSGRAWR